MTTTSTPTLSPLADAMLEHAWVLCTPADAVARLVWEFSDMNANNELGFTWDDRRVEPAEFVDALNEIIIHFVMRGTWSDDSPAVEMAQPRKSLNLRRWWKS